MNIYLGTVSMEKNRWGSKEPSFEVSKWLEKARVDGFDGIELWEGHLTRASATEYKALCDTDFPIVFNCYERFDDDNITPALEKLAEHIKNVGAFAVKFNLAKCDKMVEEQLRLIWEWQKLVPEHVQMWCECHAGSAMEDVGNAQNFFLQTPSPRFNAIVHIGDFKKQLDEKIQAYGDRIVHIHLQTFREDNVRTCLCAQKEWNEAALDALLKLPQIQSATVEFTKEEDTPAGMYANAVEDLKFIKSYLAGK